MSEGMDEILKGLDQEQRLKLLERLIQGAAGVDESLSMDERLGRLEERILGGAGRPGSRRIRVERRLGGDCCWCC